MKTEIVGMANLQKILSEMPSKTVTAIHNELVKVTLDLRGKAQKLAPLDIGYLQESAFSEVEKTEGVVGFTEPYALRQHEELGYKHKQGRTAKYLETPFKANSQKYADAIIAASKKAVGDK